MACLVGPAPAAAADHLLGGGVATPLSDLDVPPVQVHSLPGSVLAGLPAQAAPTAAQLPKLKVSAKVSKVAKSVNQFKVAGVVKYAKTGKALKRAKVTVTYRVSGSKAWRKLATPRTNIQGRYQTTVKISKTGQVRVQVAKSKKHRSVISAARKVTVTAKPVVSASPSAAPTLKDVAPPSAVPTPTLAASPTASPTVSGEPTTSPSPDPSATGSASPTPTPSLSQGSPSASPTPSPSLSFPTDPPAQPGQLWAWGDNRYGQLGHTDGWTAQTMPGLNNVASIHVDGSSTYALKTDGTVWAWGHNEQGQLGNGTNVNSVVPGQVVSLTNVTKIATRGSTVFALRSDGTVWAWGYNGSGRFGVAGQETHLIPIQVTNLSGVVDIVTNNQLSATYVLKSDGTVWAWGYNNDGRLGDGSTQTRLLPVQVNGLTDVARIIASSQDNVYALKSDGTVWSWGSNLRAQLGDGTLTNRLTPVQVLQLSDIIDVVAGNSTAFAVDANGVVWVGVC
ncbi:MAG: hypothetical protein LBG70_03735 [Bifidobacteriaceae bacterium]|nr:hypothetical protein [Bifidobacteriaceae bacterium]